MSRFASRVKQSFDRQQIASTAAAVISSSQQSNLYRSSDAERHMRQALIKSLLEANAQRANRGTSGNACVRWEDGLLITPSGLPYSMMSHNDIVFIDEFGKPHGTKRPSSEWRFHHRILKERPDIGAIVHLHSPAATALASLRLSLPPFHYMIAVAGGDTIRCAEYATFGTEDLAANAVEALKDRRACLLANHGQIACGRDLTEALDLALEVESLCEHYLKARNIGEPVLLSPDQMTAVLKRFSNYVPDPMPSMGEPLNDDVLDLTESADQDPPD